MNSRQQRNARREAVRQQRKVAAKAARAQNPIDASHVAAPLASSVRDESPNALHRTLEAYCQKHVGGEREEAVAFQAGPPLPPPEFSHSKTLRAAANRANSLLSTGPRTASGKASSSQDAFKTGMYSKQVVLPSEDLEAFQDLRDSLYADNQPIDTMEEILVNEIAESFWRLRRFRAYEAACMSPDSELTLPQLAVVTRICGSVERSFYKAQDALAKLHKARGFVPYKQARAAEKANTTGFVPAKSSRRPDSKYITRPEPVANPGFVPSTSPQNPKAGQLGDVQKSNSTRVPAA